MDRLTEITDALANLDEDLALSLIRTALADGVAGSNILKACQDGMASIGSKFEEGDYFVTDLVLAGEIFREAGEILRPALQAVDSGGGGKIVFGTVTGDIHDLGKNIVVLMLQSAGFEVIDLGVDVPPARFVEALRESGATVLGLSGLLTFAYAAMRQTVAAVAEAGLRDRVRIMVGGGPVDANVCKAVGADNWGSNANVAVRFARQWLQPEAGTGEPTL